MKQRVPEHDLIVWIFNSNTIMLIKWVKSPISLKIFILTTSYAQPQNSTCSTLHIQHYHHISSKYKTPTEKTLHALIPRWHCKGSNLVSFLNHYPQTQKRDLGGAPDSFPWLWWLNPARATSKTRNPKTPTRGEEGVRRGGGERIGCSFGGIRGGVRRRRWLWRRWRLGFGAHGQWMRVRERACASPPSSERGCGLAPYVLAGLAGRLTPGGVHGYGYRDLCLCGGLAYPYPRRRSSGAEPHGLWWRTKESVWIGCWKEGWRQR
jgi:hypothetical protein